MGNVRLTIFSKILVPLLLVTTSHAASCTREANGVIDPTLDCSPAAICNGSTDDGPVFAAAMSVLNVNGGTLKVPAKSCMVNSPLNITHSNLSIQCAGPDFACTLETSAASMPQITATVFVAGTNPGGVTNISVRGLVLEHTVAPTLGGDGIVFTGWVNASDIENVSVNYGYNDVVLGPCSISRARNLFLSNAIQDNLELLPQPGTNGNTLQWDIDSVGLGGAGRFGVFVTTSGATANVIVGDWHNLQTYLNGGGSVSVQAQNPAYSINDLRIDKSWFCCSNAGEYEVYVAAGTGVNNRLQDSTVEICNGYGIGLAATDYDFTISGTKFNGCKKSGIVSYAKHLVLDGVISNGNGIGVAGDGADIFGSAVVSGFWATGNNGWGLSVGSNATVYGSAGDLSGNVSGAVTGANSANSKLCAFNGVTGLCN
jgi:hypothetical protein